VEAHGGYLCRFEDVDVSWLVQQGQLALEDEGLSASDVGLCVTLLPGGKVIRFAFDAPYTYGRTGARWYLTHQALAQRLSQQLRATVHAYVFDPDELEQVTSWGGGRKVGGERLRYEDVELPDDDDLTDEDESSFEKLKAKWPLGHLATVLGVSREELIRLPRQQTALLELSRPAPHAPLWRLFPAAFAGVSAGSKSQVAVRRRSA